MNNRDSIVRVYLIYIFVLLFAFAIIVKIATLQFIDRDELKKKSEKQRYSMRVIKAPRGNIYADNDQKTSLALSVPRYKVYMDLMTVDKVVFEDQISSLSDSLSKLFHFKTSEQWEFDLRKERSKGNMYYHICSGIRNNQLSKIKGFPIFKLGKYAGGFIPVKKNKRIKPYGTLANRTIGYVVENAGNNSILVGIEGAFNEELKGSDGEMLMEKIRGNEWKPVAGKYSKEPIPGSDVYTSIDINIQDVAETALLKQLKDQNALRGCVVLMEVETGYIKAIANLTLDKETETYFESQNHAVGLASEPGSTFKLASLMVALEDKKIKITDSVNMTGKYTYYDHSLDDGGKVHGKNTIQFVFEKSSNIVSQIINDHYKENPQQFIDGLKRIGLHNKLGIPIKGEGKPYIKDANDESFSGISLPWMSIGYEVQFTPLQILAFYNAVANNGVMVKPQFVKEIRSGDHVKQKFLPEVINPKICNNATLKSVQKMLKGVVERGTAKNIKARGFSIAGKTGTSKIAKGSKGYGNKYQASFCGYFPAEKPRYSCIVVIQGPTRDIFGSIVSGTVFKEIADKVYARGFENNSKEEQHQDLLYPFSKHGNQADIINVSGEMNIPIRNYSDGSDWIVTQATQTGIKINRRKIVKGKVPNVLGMGLIDALYLLEEQGLSVKVNGSGLVINQSMDPGQKVLKGQQIIIDLS